jgi:ATP-dependent Lhr-like helicase
VTPSACRRLPGAWLGIDRAGPSHADCRADGSGKTLAAFLFAIDELVRESLDGPLPDEVRVLYVSPLKALSTDIHKNLEEPRQGLRAVQRREGCRSRISRPPSAPATRRPRRGPRW